MILMQINIIEKYEIFCDVLLIFSPGTSQKMSNLLNFYFC